MANSIISPEVFERAMASLFVASEFTGSDFDKMSQLLLQFGKVEWSYRPRTYAVLRMIDRVDLFDSFIVEGLKDIAFPYTTNQLPQALNNSSLRSEFLAKQDMVSTKPTDLENGGSRHRHFAQDADIDFDNLGILGRDGFGEVHHVRLKSTREEFARKRLHRRKAFSRDKDAIVAFENELTNLKRLSHFHLVRFVGSYSDPKYISILISPVADYDLKTLLRRTPLPEKDLILLRGFYGCLCSAVLYLHENNCCHKDLKPENISIKNQKVLITDFGTARDWSNYSQSITTGDTGSYTKLYAAPEVISQEPRGSSADIWSLGCVYLDMTTVLNGESLDDKFGFFEKRGTLKWAPAENLRALDMWCKRELPKNSDEQPIQWIRQMMQEDLNLRLTAAALLNQIQTDNGIHVYYNSCCNGENESSDDASYQGSIFDEKMITHIGTRHVDEALTTLAFRGSNEEIFSGTSDSLEAKKIKDYENQRAIMVLTEEGFSISSDGFEIEKAFIWAAEKGHEVVVRLLLEKEVDVATKGIHGETALHWAAFHNVEMVARLLLKKRADFAAKDDLGRTPLHWAAEHGQEGVARLLLEKGADVAAKDINKQTALHWAATEGQEAVARLLLEKGADVAMKDINEQTALHCAAKRGRKAIARLLLEKGADVAATDINKQTALHWAVVYGKEGVTRLLLEKGADISAKDIREQTVLHWAAEHGRKAMVQLLVEEGADVAAKDISEQTALHRAAWRGQEAVARLLLEKGADVAAKDIKKQTALHWAAKRGREPVARLLLEKGVDITAKDDLERTALHWAAQRGQEQVARLLVFSGADVAAKNIFGETALHEAAVHKHERVAMMLRLGGANTQNTATRLGCAARGLLKRALIPQK